jgi:fructose-1,6-bisphosphatase/inositol monophosphatase family enzyme
MRRFGGDCYSYALLAGGQIDLVVEASMQPYDYMALVPVIEGAGGTVTDWHGRPLDLASDGKVVAAATSELHAEVIDRLRR